MRQQRRPRLDEGDRIEGLHYCDATTYRNSVRKALQADGGSPERKAEGAETAEATLSSDRKGNADHTNVSKHWKITAGHACWAQPRRGGRTRAGSPPEAQRLPGANTIRQRIGEMARYPFPSFRRMPSAASIPLRAAPTIPRDLPTPSPATNRFGTFVSRYRSVVYFVS